MARFRDRRDAGRTLARKLMHYADRTDVLALALPRGGVPVAYEIALALHVPLDVFIGVGRWYEDFEQTTDEGVRLFLQDIRQQLLHA